MPRKYCWLALLVLFAVETCQSEDAALASDEEVKQWLSEVAAADFDVRNAAEAKLLRAAAAPARLKFLRDTAKETKDADVRMRLDRTILRAEVGPVARVDVGRIFLEFEKVKAVQTDLANAFAAKSAALEQQKGKMPDAEWTEKMKGLGQEIEKYRCLKMIEILKDIDTGIADWAKASGSRLVIRADAGKAGHLEVPEARAEIASPATAAEAVKEFGKQPIRYKAAGLANAEALAPGKSLDVLVELAIDATDDVIKRLNQALKK